MGVSIIASIIDCFSSLFNDALSVLDCITGVTTTGIPRVPGAARSSFL